MLHGYVLSDLHLLTQRSVAWRHMADLHLAAGKADFFVLNGDIFDFKWTVLDTVEQTVAAAAQWVRELAEAHPNCKFYYVLGNHDCLQAFVNRLDRLSGELGNFGWVPSHLRIGTALFLHGDLPLRRREADFSRRPRPTEKKKSRFLEFCYRVVVAVRAHRSVELVRSRRQYARRVHAALAADETGIGQGVTDVYFGHTHAPLSDYRFNGMTFHNTGSAIRGLECNLASVAVQKASLARA